MNENENIELVDEAMMSLSGMLEDLIAPIQNNELTRVELDMPVQIQILTDAEGKTSFGITPPLYKIETSFNPVYHQVRFTCEIDE